VAVGAGLRLGAGTLTVTRPSVLAPTSVWGRTWPASRQRSFSPRLSRLRSVELAGQPAYVETLFVGGPKHLPIRYDLS
jgi:hypothetical protein